MQAKSGTQRRRDRLGRGRRGVCRLFCRPLAGACTTAERLLDARRDELFREACGEARAECGSVGEVMSRTGECLFQLGSSLPRHRGRIRPGGLESFGEVRVARGFWCRPRRFLCVFVGIVHGEIRGWTSVRIILFKKSFRHGKSWPRLEPRRKFFNGSRIIPRGLRPIR